jgi:undecaprenyl-phosphate galactose phosphotransferase
MEPQYFFNHDVMLMVPGSNLEQPLPRFLKRAFDVLASGFALLLLSPILLPVAFLVRRDGGPSSSAICALDGTVGLFIA